MTLQINVARDYSPYPLGRQRDIWPYSGERFREDYLQPPLREGEIVWVDLTGTRGLAPSFLEEAFGGLIGAGVPYEVVKNHLKIITEDASRFAEIWHYINDAAGVADEVA